MASFLGGLFARLKPSLLPERKARTKKRWEGNAVGARRAGLDHVTFVAITGSCGKSTARALTAAILEMAGPCQHGETWNVDRLGHVLKRVGPETRSCVCEIGATGPGALSEPLRLLRPQIGIVTTIGGDHYTAFRILPATALEKGKLVECLPPNGTAILNADDLLVLGMAERTGARVMTFGISEHAHVRASEISSQGRTLSHSRRFMRESRSGSKPGSLASIGSRRCWPRLPVGSRAASSLRPVRRS